MVTTVRRSQPRPAGRYVSTLLKAVRNQHGSDHLDLFLLWQDVIAPPWSTLLKPLRITKHGNKNILQVGYDEADGFTLHYQQEAVLYSIQQRFPSLDITALRYKKMSNPIKTQKTQEVILKSPPTSLQEAIERLQERINQQND